MLPDTADADMAMHPQNTFRTLCHLSYRNMQIPFEGSRGCCQHRNDPAVHRKTVMLHIFLQDHIHRMYQFETGPVLSFLIFYLNCKHCIMKVIITIFQKSVSDRQLRQLFFPFDAVKIHIVIQKKRHKKLL